MKKKTLLISGIGLFLILIAIVLAFILPKPVRVGYEEIPVDVNSTPKMRIARFSNYIENTEDLRNALDKIYENPTQAEKEAMLSSEPLKKYDDKFFEENFLYVSTAGSEYKGNIYDGPLIKIKKQRISEENKLVLQVDVTSKSTKQESLGIGLTSPDASFSYTYSPRGYVLEISRKQFERYNMAYDDIQIVYLNGEDTLFNIQIGRNKIAYDPYYPMPDNAQMQLLSEEPRVFLGEEN